MWKLHDGMQVQQEMSLAKSQALTTPLKSSLEVVGAQVKLEAAGAGVISPGASLPGCSVRSLLQDMGLQVTHPPSLSVAPNSSLEPVMSFLLKQWPGRLLVVSVCKFRDSMPGVSSSRCWALQHVADVWLYKQGRQPAKVQH